MSNTMTCVLWTRSLSQWPRRVLNQLDKSVAYGREEAEVGKKRRCTQPAASTSARGWRTPSETARRKHASSVGSLPACLVSSLHRLLSTRRRADSATSMRCKRTSACSALTRMQHSCTPRSWRRSCATRRQTGWSVGTLTDFRMQASCGA